MSTPFSILIKPAGAACNLRCSYCYYICNMPKRSVPMSPKTLETLIRNYMSVPLEEYVFCWQGGEATLLGKSFYENVLKLQRRYAPPHARVFNSLQSNATLIDDELAAFFTENGFFIGVSLDGPPELHDYYRRTAAGEGSHALVMRGIEALRRNKTEFNVLTLVSSANVREPLTVYRYLRDEVGIAWHQYIPCVEYAADRRPLPWCITGEQWGDFLCTVFDEWYEHDMQRVSVRMFDALLEQLQTGHCGCCDMWEDCRCYLAIEADGSVYPCDFFMTAEERLGSVYTDSLAALRTSRRYLRFSERKKRLTAECRSCPVLKYCHGDCLKHRFAVGDERSLSPLCEGRKRFFTYAAPKVGD